MTGDHDIPITDSDFLDGLLERALERIEDGESPTAEVLIGERVHLRAAAEELIALARQIAASAPQDAPELPTVPGYTLIRELGHGGMGTVYLARQEALGGRPVALKFLAGSASFSAQARERLLGEAKAIAKLQHPNIVAVYDVVKAGPMVAYAMELVDGPSLAQLIDEARDQVAKGSRDRGWVPHLSGVGDGSLVRESILEPLQRGIPSPETKPPDRNPAKGGTEIGISVQQRTTVPLVPWSLDPSTVCRVGIAMGRALGAVHAAGLLHRDVKPSNILLRKDGTPLLSDFGLAKATHDSLVTAHPPTVTAGFVGTPAYAAPEQLRAEGARLDARTDVYGLGVTLYHALTLRAPFHGRSTHDILREIEGGLAPPVRRVNPKLPRELETIVATSMDPDPARRYATADELADDLERLLNLQPIRARPAGLVTRGFKLVRRNRRALAAGTVGGIAALAIAIALGAYLFMVPGWVADHLAEARLALLNPAHREAIFIGLHLPDDARGRSTLSPEMAAAMGESLRRYRLALRWAALRPQAGRIRLERDTVALAAELMARQAGHGIPEPSAALRQSAPHTCEAAAAWLRPDTHLGLNEDRLADATPEDLRCLGLLAFLAGRAEWCNRAWSKGGFDLTDDPLVDASLGQLYLELDRPALALPRLEQAFRAFPQAGFLCVDLASAAVGVGDLALARRRLEQAETLDRRDTFNTLKRVRADYYAARAAAQPSEGGEADAARARELYEWVARRHKAPTAKYNYAVFLEARGQPREGLAVLGKMSPSRLTIRKYSEAFVAMADRWWSARTVEERWKLVRGALDENPFDPGSFVAILRTYMECRVRIADQAGRPGVIDAPSSSNGEGEGGWGATPPRPNPLTPSPRSGEGDSRPGGTLENSPAFQGWEHDGQSNPSPVGTTEPTSTVPTGLDAGEAPNPSDKSLGYSHGVPPARPRFRFFDFSIFRLFSAAFSPPDSSSFLQRVSLTQMAHTMEVQNMSRWSVFTSYPAVLKEVQFSAWFWPWPRPASNAIESAAYTSRAVRRAVQVVAATFMLTGPTHAGDQAWVTYDASLGTFPASQCFVENATSDAAPAVIVAGQLCFSTLPGTNGGDGTGRNWRRDDVIIDFSQGFTMEVDVRIVSSQDRFAGTSDYPRIGYQLYASDSTGKYVFLFLASSSIVLTNHGFIGVDGVNCRRLTFPVAGMQRNYRVEIGSNGANLFINGVLQDLHIPLSAASIHAPNDFIFGDGTGWANSESYTRLVRFTGVDPSCCATFLDCNSNGMADNCDISGGTSVDANSDGIPDECEQGAPAATMTNAASRKNCDMSLLPSPTSEPRQGGVTELRIAFDTPPGGPGLDPVTLEVATCAAPAFVPYSGTSTIGAAVTGSELILTFTPGLENGRTYRVNIGAEVTSIPNQSVEFRVLLGDVNGDGLVNATDRSAVVGIWTGSGFTCATDANDDGQTNATDRSIVVGAWTSPQNCAP